MITETKALANSLDAFSGAEREEIIPIIPDKWETRQGMKCTRARRKLLSPKSRLRFGKQGRPKQSWRRTVIKELESIGKTWAETEKIAMNRVRWKAMVEALCLTRGKED